MANDDGAAASGWIAAGLSAPTPSHRHKRFGDPVRIWEYLDSDGNRIGYINRYEPPYPDPEAGDRGKQYVPLTFDGKRWQFKKWPGAQPLYGLDLLADKPEEWVIVCEGEKSADAARELFPGVLVISAPGGWGQYKYADWSPLYGRKGVILWPDADQPGWDVMDALAAHLASHGVAVKIIDTHGQAEGWDAADALAEGYTPAGFKAWSKPRTKVYKGPKESPWEEVARPSTERNPRDGRNRGSAYAEAAPNGLAYAEPLDLFARPLLPKLKSEHLPRALRDYVFDQSELIGSDPGILAISALVSVAGASHDAWRVRMKKHDDGGFSERPCLWGAWIAGPGARKSPASSRATSVLRKIDHAWSETYVAALREFAIEQKVHKECESKYIKARAKAVMDRGAFSSPVEPPKAPQDRRLLADDATIESLALLLQENPRGIVMPFDELSGWFGSMDAYKSGGVTSLDRSRWLESYEGGPRRIDRVSRKGDPIMVPNWSLCVMGGIQPDSMRSIAAKLPEDGLLQRFMLTMAVDAVEDQDRPYNSAAKARYTSMITRLANDAAPTTHVILSDEARQEFLWLSREASAIARAAMISPRMKSHLGKIDGLFGRLCITYHLAESADRGIAPPPQVSGKTASTVADFMREYLAGHMRAFYDDLLADSRHRAHAVWIAGHILAHQLDSIENRRLLMNYRGWDALPDWTKDSALRMLVDAGWLYEIHGENPGRRVSRWEVNPAVHSRFAQYATREAERRRAETDEIRRTAFGRALTGDHG